MIDSTRGHRAFPYREQPEFESRPYRRQRALQNEDDAAGWLARRHLLSIPNVAGVEKVADLKEEAQTVELIKESIVNIFDEENVYEGADLTKLERDEFVDSLTFPQLELLGKWFDQLPKLTTTLEWDCEECGTKNEQKLEGIQNFF